MNRSLILRLALSLALIALLRMAVGGQTAAPNKMTFTRTISALTNIYAAGETNSDNVGGGNVPEAINLLPGKGRSVVLQTATGDASCCGPIPVGQSGLHGPDGNRYPFQYTDITGANHLSGIIHKDRILFLVGVFLSADYTHDPTPPVLQYSLDGRQIGTIKTIPTSFNNFAPALNQVFFLGDGSAGDNPSAGKQQRFYIPDGANRFYMGYVDGLNIGSGGGFTHQPPGYYSDNAGGAQVVVEVDAPIDPAPPLRYAIADLGSLKKDNHLNSYLGASAALALNDNGQVAGWSDTFSNLRHAFCYSGGLMQDMGTEGGDCIATGINNLGSVIGYSNTAPSVTSAFLHDFTSPLPTLQFPQDTVFTDGSVSRAYGIGLIPRTPNQSFTLADLLVQTLFVGGVKPTPADVFGTFEKIYNPVTKTSSLVDTSQGGLFNAINGDGTVRAGFRYADGGTHGFVNTTSSVDVETQLKQQMAVPDGYSVAYGVNTLKHVIGAYDSAPDGSSSRAFVYDAGTNEVLDLAFGSSGPSYAFGINNNDVAVGSNAAPDDMNNSKALLFQNSRVYDLNTQIDSSLHWNLQKAFAINRQGQIAGVGVAPNGEQHAFLLTPISPSAAIRQYPLPPSRVLVIANKNSTDSMGLAEYYMTKRNIPFSNYCKIDCATTEDVTLDDYYTNIAAPVQQFIAENNLHVDSIVVMKGVPLRADFKFAGMPRDYQNAYLQPNRTGLSVTSLLATLDMSIAALANQTPRIFNPYYKGPFSHQPYAEIDPNSLPVNQSKTRFRHIRGGIYLVTRLDAYTFPRCKDLVSRSLKPNMNGGWFLTQPDPNTPNFGDVEDQMANSHDLMIAKGLNSSLDYRFAYPTGSDIVGYATFGSNHHSYQHPVASPIPDQAFMNFYYGTADQRAEALKDPFVSAYLNTTFRPGSIATMLVSFSGRSFVPTSFNTDKALVQNQPLVADLIEQGVTGVQGSVDEPGGDFASHPDILFDAYTSGYSLAESFYMGMRYVYYMDVIIGDPLCAPYAYVTTALDYSNAATIIPLGPIRRRGPGPVHTFEQIAIQANDPIPGPVRLVVSNLPAGTRLVNQTGLTQGGEPYITVANTGFAQYANFTVQLEMLGVTGSYNVSLIAGDGAM